MSDEPNIVGQVAQFDPEGSMFGPNDQAIEEVKQSTTDEVVEETDTPTELPAESAKVDEQPADNVGEDTKQSESVDLTKATEGLRNEIVILRQKLAIATGNDRKIAGEQLVVAQQNLDDLKDVNPSDVELVEKVLKAKGYITKDEAVQREYETVQNQVLNSFLEKFPEYKPENDPDNINWKTLMGEYSLYAKPKDPHKIAELLDRAHKSTNQTQVVSDRSLPAKKRAAQVASSGAGGTQRSSSSGKTLSPQERAMYENGGWSEEDIKRIEQNLSN